jgi:carbon starvation protein CstA
MPPVNALWLMLAALAVLAIAYRYYSAFLAAKVMALSDARATPAHTMADGRNYVPTNRYVVRPSPRRSGRRPLIGPVLAAQFGYLPASWLSSASSSLAPLGFQILVASVRRKGKCSPKSRGRRSGRSGEHGGRGDSRHRRRPSLAWGSRSSTRSPIRRGDR